jgi:uncharacterized protein (TIGR00288 family)
MNEKENALAVFIDFENLALGFKHKKEKRFDIQKVLARLVEKGKIIVKKAYADWAGYADYKGALHEAAIELIDIPKRSVSGKNSADIRLCVDSIDLCYSKEHIDTFVIVSGDSDFSPLVSKLKENGKRVIGLGMKESSSHLLIDNCDEFIYYEDLERPVGTPPKIEQDLPKQKKEAFQLLVDSVIALVRENKEVLWPSTSPTTVTEPSVTFSKMHRKRGSSGSRMIRGAAPMSSRASAKTRRRVSKRNPRNEKHRSPAGARGRGGPRNRPLFLQHRRRLPLRPLVLSSPSPLTLTPQTPDRKSCDLCPKKAKGIAHSVNTEDKTRLLVRVCIPT